MTCIQKLHSLETAHGEVNLDSVWVEDSIYVTLGPFSSKPTQSGSISVFTAPEHQQPTNSQSERKRAPVAADADGRREARRMNTTAADLWAVGVVGLCVFGVDGVLQAVRSRTGVHHVCAAVAAAVAEGAGGRETRQEGEVFGRAASWRASRDAKEKSDKEGSRRYMEDSESESGHTDIGALRASICEALDRFPRLRSLLAINPAKRDFKSKSTEAVQEPQNRCRDPSVSNQVWLDLELTIQEIRKPIHGSRYSSIGSITDDTFTCSLIMPDKTNQEADIAHTEKVEIPLVKIETQGLGSWVANELGLSGIRDPTFSLDLKLACSRKQSSNTSGKVVCSELGLAGPLLASLSQNGSQIRESRWIVMENASESIQSVIRVEYAVRATSTAMRLVSRSSKWVPSTITSPIRNIVNSSIPPTNLTARMSHTRADSLERQQCPMKSDKQQLLDPSEQPKPPKPPNPTLHSPKPPVRRTERGPALTNPGNSAYPPFPLATELLSPLSASLSSSNPPEESSNTRADSHTRRERLSRKYSVSSPLNTPQAPPESTTGLNDTDSDNLQALRDAADPTNTQAADLKQKLRAERSAVRAFLRKGLDVVGDPVPCNNLTLETLESGAMQPQQHTRQDGDPAESTLQREGVEGQKNESVVTELRHELQSSIKRYQDQYGLLGPKNEPTQTQEQGLSGQEVAGYDNLLRKLKDFQFSKI